MIHTHKMNQIHCILQFFYDKIVEKKNYCWDNCILHTLYYCNYYSYWVTQSLHFRYINRTLHFKYFIVLECCTKIPLSLWRQKSIQTLSHAAILHHSFSIKFLHTFFMMSFLYSCNRCLFISQFTKMLPY